MVSKSRVVPPAADCLENDKSTVDHVVGEVRVEQAKIEAIERMQLPKTKKEVKVFLWLTGYYRKFIPDYATNNSHTTHRQESVNQILWIRHQNVRQPLPAKHAPCTAPVLMTPHIKPFILQTDPSDRGGGLYSASQ